MQLDGFAFHRPPPTGAEISRPMHRLALRGYTVLRFDYFQIFFQWDQVVETILTAVAQGLHRHRIR